jgi:hypothetical protein
MSCYQDEYQVKFETKGVKVKKFSLGFRIAFRAAGGLSTFRHPIVSYQKFARIGFRKCLGVFLSLVFPREPKSSDYDGVADYKIGLQPENSLVIRVRPIPQRINIITDSINRDTLFGGVATSIILGNELAKRIGADLRIVTRMSVSSLRPVKDLLSTLEISSARKIECEFISIDSCDMLEVSERDLFLTTSWWTTRDALLGVPPEKIVYLLQEDERIFYSSGVDYLAAQETINKKNLRIVVNTDSLKQHLIKSGLINLIDTSTSFEPSFRYMQNLPKGPKIQGKRNLFFYARPGHSRNLFPLGVDVIEKLIQLEYLDPDKWEINFVGYNQNRFTFSSGLAALVHPPQGISEYRKLIHKMDLGLSLMASPHPSYPVFDLAAAGKIVVTNNFNGKMDLSNKVSKNIIQVEPTISNLIDGVCLGIARLDENKDIEDKLQMPYGRSWESNLEAVISKFLGSTGA